MSPIQRSIKYFKDRGHVVEKVEQWNSFAKFRKDLFGIFDLLVLSPKTEQIYGVQVTTGDHHAEHKLKMQASLNLDFWKHCHAIALLHSWSKQGDRGKRKLWTLREEVI